MPVFHECQRCTACCRWPGQVRVSEAEIARLAVFLGMSEVDFIQRHTRLAADRRGLALQEQPGGECVFLEGADCRVQPVKPQQCRDFPNLWNFPGFEQICRAIPRLVDDAEYARLIARATGRRVSDANRAAESNHGLEPRDP
jgi:Fe-S-cluster containining protein